MEQFVLRLKDGGYLRQKTPGWAGRPPESCAGIDQAARFPTRLTALKACSNGPAAFFDRAVIMPVQLIETPQDDLGDAGIPSEAQEGQEGPFTGRESGENGDL